MLRSTLILTGLLILCSCSNPATDKPIAATSEAVPVSSPVAAQGEKYSITPANSKIEFDASKVTGSHHGAFEKFSGTIDYSGQPEKSRVTITIDTTSVTTDDPKLTTHLKTPDFFDVAKHPSATFTSTEIKPAVNKGEKGASHTVTGNLQLHGVTKSVSFPATIAATPGAVTVESTFSINRKDFGINYAGATDNLIRDEVVLTLHVRAVK